MYLYLELRKEIRTRIKITTHHSSFESLKQLRQLCQLWIHLSLFCVCVQCVCVLCTFLFAEETKEQEAIYIHQLDWMLCRVNQIVSTRKRKSLNFLFLDFKFKLLYYFKISFVCVKLFKYLYTCMILEKFELLFC